MGIELLSSHPFLSLSNHPECHDVREILSDISLSCDAAIDTLNDLLLFEKIEDGKMKLDKRKILISDLLARCVKPFDLQVSETAHRTLSLSLPRHGIRRSPFTTKQLIATLLWIIAQSALISTKSLKSSEISSAML
jgi:signal transduction histidine kinase